MEEQLEKLWERLDRWHKNSDAKMSKENYLDMMEQLGKEPIEEEMPPGIEDFPEIVINALETFNGLGDRIFGDVGYVGKDYTNLPYFMRIFGIEEADEETFLTILLKLDAQAIEISNKRMKAEMDRIKRKRG